MNYSPLLSGAATTAVSLPLPVFPSLICLLITSIFAPLCLSLPVVLLVQLPRPLIVAVSPQRCWCQGNRWAVAADVCNLGNRSLTCSGINPSFLLCHTKALSSFPPYSYITYCMFFLFLMLSSSFHILLFLFFLLS